MGLSTALDDSGEEALDRCAVDAGLCADVAGVRLQGGHSGDLGNEATGVEAVGAEPASADGEQRLPDERRAAGTFAGVQRTYRKQQAPNFAIIEAVLDEPADCGQRQGCAATPRCAAHGGTQCRRWLVRGPVLGWSDDAVRLTTNVTVRAAMWMPMAEVYVRALPHLVPSVYARSTVAYGSVRFVAGERTELAADSGVDPQQLSFRGFPVGDKLTDKDVKEVLKRATSSLLAAKGKLHRGHVPLVARRDARCDPVLKAAVRGVLRKRSIRAAAEYRDKGAALMRKRTAGLHGLLGAGAIGRVRRHLELQERASSGSRATRLRVAWGLSQMRLLPSRRELQRIRREYIDAPGRVAHYFLTYSAQGELQRWDYVVGSGSAGIRRYETASGMEKRLRAHTNKYWDQRRNQRDDQDVSDNEDDGIYFDNSNVELDGCYAPDETDPVAIKQLIANSESYLEDEDGSGAVKVLGVGFDVVTALQQTMDTHAVPDMTEEHVQAFSPAVLTFAADGGTVRRRSITAYTLSVSTPCLLAERTDLTPILYMFASEKRVDRAVMKWVRDQLAAVFLTTFYVPVVADDDEAPVGEEAASDDRDSSRNKGRCAPLRWDPVMHVCGTFNPMLWATVRGGSTGKAASWIMWRA